MLRILGVLLLAGPACVQAQVFKCTNPDGSVVFSEEACGDNAEMVTGLDEGSSGIGASVSGPPRSLTLADGSVLEYKRIISLELQTETGYKTGRQGLHIFYEGTDHEVAWENLVSMYVTSWDRDYCGNLAHICLPRVRIVTTERVIAAHYRALRNIKVLVNDELDGQEKEMTVWFGNRNRPHIRAVRF